MYMASLTSKIAILCCLALVFTSICEARGELPSEQVSRRDSLTEGFAQVDSVIPETSALLEGAGPSKETSSHKESSSKAAAKKSAKKSAKKAAKATKAAAKKAIKKQAAAKKNADKLAAKNNPTSTSCNTHNKQKSIYTHFKYLPPLSTRPALDVAGDVIWGNLDQLRNRNSNGLFNAYKLAFHLKRKGVGGSGYMGPQVSNGKNQGVERVLFSLWDFKPQGQTNAGGEGWMPALPLSDCTKDPKKNPGTVCCKRNCQDCAAKDHTDGLSDGSTGTQCKVYLPVKIVSGMRLRTRIRRVGVGVKATAYGKDWTGDAWEVTVQDVTSGKQWLVGKQLLTAAPANGSGGLESVSNFYEFIGCTPCDAYDSSSTREGPWVLEPKGVQLMSATSVYQSESTCRKHQTFSTKPGSFTIKAGPHTPEDSSARRDGTWNKNLYRCPHDTGCKPPVELQQCQDKPERWYDSYGDSCENHKKKQWCTSNGGYGPKWQKKWGKFSKYINNRWPGIDATKACCACGGGTKPVV